MSFITNLRNWAAQRMAVDAFPGGNAEYLRQAGGIFAGTSTDVSVYETAAVEFAVGIVGRAAMAAEVKVSGATLDPYTMAQLFRETILLGESVHVIDLNRRTGMTRLLPIATRPIITGGSTPERWRYEIKLPRPNGEDPLDIDQLPSRNVGAEGMVHVRYMPYPLAPWIGVSPLQSARFTAETLARIERSLQDDAKIPTGAILPQPDGISDAGITQVKTAVTAGKGGLTLIETTRGGFGLGKESAPERDWDQKRFGANAPASSIQLWEAAMLAVMAALGVPPSLYTSQGAALRESYRHLFGSLMEPLGKLIEAELSEKLDEEITIRWPERLKSDISAMSRGFSSLAKDGYPLEQLHDMLGFPGDAPPEPEPEPAPVPPDPAAVPAPPGQPQPGTTPSSTERTAGRIWYSRRRLSIQIIASTFGNGRRTSIKTPTRFYGNAHYVGYRNGGS